MQCLFWQMTKLSSDMKELKTWRNFIFGVSSFHFRLIIINVYLGLRKRAEKGKVLIHVVWFQIVCANIAPWRIKLRVKMKMSGKSSEKNFIHQRKRYEQLLNFTRRKNFFADYTQHNVQPRHRDYLTQIQSNWIPAKLRKLLDTITVSCERESPLERLNGRQVESIALLTSCYIHLTLIFKLSDRYGCFSF